MYTLFDKRILLKNQLGGLLSIHHQSSNYRACVNRVLNIAASIIFSVLPEYCNTFSKVYVGIGIIRTYTLIIKYW